ncbi:hypothetical protein [Jannaschia seohaensis]|uniref:Uncharacterized protein n=1 Tax=Jannaschia seohaensis TaxID=475081 RepID=A0A2Y9BXY5_9RHOB|nr:hypothetical protein [Jannaschia seohaensis]PWJ21262.1 hypothetical protein BCF38_102512 [Jannaschia seohaensis]SSA41672.1 hypothetical protein SAMN05421539_102512 [Jannaschia seohaensis]
MALPLRLAVLTYANAALVYGLVTYPETGSLPASLQKVAVSLWWLIPLTTPFAVLFALAGAPVVRATLAHTAHFGRWRSGTLATLAFLIPAAALVEAALALRDGFSPVRFAIQIAGGLTLAALWATVRGR